MRHSGKRGLMGEGLKITLGGSLLLDAAYSAWPGTSGTESPRHATSRPGPGCGFTNYHPFLGHGTSLRQLRKSAVYCTQLEI